MRAAAGIGVPLASRGPGLRPGPGKALDIANADGQGTFAGTFTARKFSVANGVLEATGLLKGTMTDTNGTKLGTVSQTVTMPVSTGATTGGAKANATNQVLACNVLDLVLGPRPSPRIRKPSRRQHGRAITHYARTGPE